MVLAMVAGCWARQEGTAAAKRRATVVWVSVDGMRGNYLERVRPPFLMRLMREGAYTQHLRPGFPSLTFPSHVTEATGVTVAHHGIPANNFVDAATGKAWEFPPDGSLLLAEPIWMTATRQGVRTAVYDWPLSQMEAGADAAAYFNPAVYDKNQTDEQRLDRLAAAYEGDAAAHPGAEPLRLLMGYLEATDPPGHKFGPDSQEVTDALVKTDALLQRFFERVEALFQAHKRPGDVLYFLVTTDHGMVSITTGVNLALAVAAKEGGDLQVATSGPVGNVYVSRNLDPTARAKRVEEIVAQLRAKDYAGHMKVYKREELPARWGYDQPDRVGDVVAVLQSGFVFEPKQEMEIGPLANLPHGTHGYPVEWEPRMEGGMVMWRSDSKWGGKDLGPVPTVAIHGTVARWLGIQRARGAAAGIGGV